MRQKIKNENKKNGCRIFMKLCQCKINTRPCVRNRNDNKT